MLAEMREFIIGNMIAGAAIQLLNSLPWSVLILFILKNIGINNYVITEINTVKRIQKRLASKTCIINNGQAFGYICDFNLIADISKDSWDNIKVSLYCSKKTYESLTNEITSENSKIVKVEKENITIYDRCGSYKDTYYEKRNINVISIQSRSTQDAIISAIMCKYSIKNHAVALVYGPPNTGKTTIGLLVAKELNGTYCNSLQPWLPNCNLSHLYSSVEPSESSPLIIAIDEIDIQLVNIHNGLIKQNSKMPTSVLDKSGWNKFFDEIQRGMYPYLIVLLTTNKTPEFIDALDVSYIRPGRVDLIEGLY